MPWRGHRCLAVKMPTCEQPPTPTQPNITHRARDPRWRGGSSMWPCAGAQHRQFINLCYQPDGERRSPGTGHRAAAPVVGLTPSSTAHCHSPLFVLLLPLVLLCATPSLPLSCPHPLLLPLPCCPYFLLPLSILSSHLSHQHPSPKMLLQCCSHPQGKSEAGPCPPRSAPSRCLRALAMGQLPGLGHPMLQFQPLTSLLSRGDETRTRQTEVTS